MAKVRASPERGNVPESNDTARSTRRFTRAASERGKPSIVSASSTGNGSAIAALVDAAKGEAGGGDIRLVNAGEDDDD